MFKFRPSEADAFSDCLNYGKKQYEKQRRINITILSIIHVTPHFANTMLAEVLIYQYAWIKTSDGICNFSVNFRIISRESFLFLLKISLALLFSPITSAKSF